MTLQTLSIHPCDDRRLRVQTLVSGDTACVVLEGEGDISTLADLDAALTGLDLRDARFVRIDLAALTFADAATIRELTGFARQATRTGCDVRTSGASPVLRRVTEVLAVQRDLGIP